MHSTRKPLELALLFMLLLSASGCMHRVFLRPVAVVRSQARQALSCDERIEVRQLGARYEMRAQVDAYEARGCGRRYFAACDAAETRGRCVALPVPPAQGVPPDQPRAIVQLVGVHEGWAPAGADSMWERIIVGDGYAQRLTSVGDPPPLTFAVAPGHQSIALGTGPSGVHQESRIRTYESSSTWSSGGHSYRSTTTHFVPYLVDVRHDAPGCETAIDFDADAGHVYRVGYGTLRGRCAMVCSDITWGAATPCGGQGSGR